MLGCKSSSLKMIDTNTSDHVAPWEHTGSTKAERLAANHDAWAFR